LVIAREAHQADGTVESREGLIGSLAHMADLCRWVKRPDAEVRYREKAIVHLEVLASATRADRRALAVGQSDLARADLNSRQQENFNFQKISARLADFVCREVLKLKIDREHTAQVVAIPQASVAGSGGFATGLLPPAATHGSHYANSVALPGLEPGCP
jgi:hypothetical protein